MLPGRVWGSVLPPQCCALRRVLPCVTLCCDGAGMGGEGGSGSRNNNTGMALLERFASPPVVEETWGEALGPFALLLPAALGPGWCRQWRRRRRRWKCRSSECGEMGAQCCHCRDVTILLLSPSPSAQCHPHPSATGYNQSPSRFCLPPCPARGWAQGAAALGDPHSHVVFLGYVQPPGRSCQGGTGGRRRQRSLGGG